MVMQATNDGFRLVVKPDRRQSNRAASTDRDIARRAFELHCERGCQHGHDLDDWLQAERELKADGTYARLSDGLLSRPRPPKAELARTRRFAKAS